tara:strand:+ start:3428 stop:3592 length:165 start_codon:yes stop_codon:yes gene_type:complete
MPGMPNRLKVAQEAMLKEHAEHHTPKHMKMMREMMENGATFDEAHKAAKKEVGN